MSELALKQRGLEDQVNYWKGVFLVTDSRLRLEKKKVIVLHEAFVKINLYFHSLGVQMIIDDTFAELEKLNENKNE